MKWTRTIPDCSGYYWYWCDGQDSKIVMWIDPDLAVQDMFHVSELVGLWAGPLQPPPADAGGREGVRDGIINRI